MPVDVEVWAYFDTSALVKCYVHESGTAEAIALTGRHAVLSSALAPVELTGAFRRQQAAGSMSPRQHQRAWAQFRADRAHWTLLEIDANVLTRAEALIATAAVKTLDALHLASALMFQAEAALRIPFVTGDAQQRRAGEALDLDVVFVG